MKVGQKTVPQLALLSVPQCYMSALGLCVFCFSVRVVHFKLDALKALLFTIVEQQTVLVACGLPKLFDFVNRN